MLLGALVQFQDGSNCACCSLGVNGKLNDSNNNQYIEMTADFNDVVNQHTSESGFLSGLSLVMQKKLMIS